MSRSQSKIELIIGADHAGYDLKEAILIPLAALGIRYEDVGTFGHESVDYPDIARKVALAVSSGRSRRGILVCGTGVGMAITANRLSKIRAANCNDLYTARMARAHNDANVLTLGGRVIGPGLAVEIVRVFLETAFEKGRHQRRVKKMEAFCQG